MVSKFIQHPDQFKDGVRVGIVVERAKDGNAKNRTAKRFLMDGLEDFEGKMVDAFEQLQKGQRLYASVDERNVTLARKAFMIELVAMSLHYDSDVADAFMMRVHKNWMSKLMQPPFRKTKLWIHDIDTVDSNRAYEAMIRERQDTKGVYVSELHRYDTVEGKHVVTAGFNLAGMKPEDAAKIQRNGMLLWGHYL